jgi:hypothetical protein
LEFWLFLDHQAQLGVFSARRFKAHGQPTIVTSLFPHDLVLPEGSQWMQMPLEVEPVSFLE